VGFAYGQWLFDPTISAEKLTESFAWPRWKAAGLLAYMRGFAEVCRQEWEDLSSCDAQALKRSLPDIEFREVALL
jgi:hypothetical protein